MMNLSTTYLGLNLKHPIVASASPLSKSVDGIRRLEDGGVSAVVMYSLFEEQITHDSFTLDHYLSYGTDSFGEATTYFPDAPSYNFGAEEYLNILTEAKQKVDIPIIASLNGVSTSGWINYARLMELAGADALELNIYYIPTDPNVSGADVEAMYLDIVATVVSNVTIPVAVKISPYFSATANMAKRLAEQGVKALVLFNRFYQPDYNLTDLEVVPSLQLSSSYELRLPLHWTALLYGHVPTDFAITGGVHTGEDVLKAMMAGANVVQIASAFLKQGPRRAAELVEEMTRWMTEYEYESVAQMRGSLSRSYAGNPAAYERANYMRVLHTYRPDPTGWLVG
jgi:dihydroorotate dehydrogenase (fumarate)